MIFKMIHRASPMLKNARNFSGHTAEQAKAEVTRWYYISIGMVGLSLLTAAYNVATHSHEHAQTGLPYQKIRSKPYPWVCGDCNLLDLECWKECKGQAKADSSAGHH